MRIDKLICLIALIILEMPSVVVIIREVMKRKKKKRKVSRMDKIVELYQSQIDEMLENAKKEAYQDVYDQIDEGVCDLCSHNGEPRCFVTCSGYDYEKETLMKWLKEKAGDRNDES